MLAKCANPSCAAEFLYLHAGKLFLLKSAGHAPTCSARANFSGHVHGIQYAWLCDQCASKYEVVIDADQKLKVRSRFQYAGLIAGIGASIGVPLLYASALAGEFYDLVA